MEVAREVGQSLRMRGLHKITRIMLNVEIVEEKDTTRISVRHLEKIMVIKL